MATATLAPVVESAARRRTIGVTALIAVSILWSLAGLSVKLSRMDPIAFNLYRSMAAIIPMALLIPFSAGRRPPWKWLLLSALVYTSVTTPFVAAMTFGTAASGILLQYTGPAWCALFAWIFQHRAIGRRTFAAMALAGIGIAVMIAFDPPAGSMLGPGLGLFSGIAFGALILVLEKVDRTASGQANPFLIVLSNNFGATLILLPICVATGALAAHPWQLGIVGSTGVIQLALPYVLFQFALRRVHPVDASLLILLEPVLNPVWVAIFVGEAPGPGTILGGLCILSAMALEATNRP